MREELNRNFTKVRRSVDWIECTVEISHIFNFEEGVSARGITSIQQMQEVQRMRATMSPNNLMNWSVLRPGLKQDGKSILFSGWSVVEVGDGDKDSTSRTLILEVLRSPNKKGGWDILRFEVSELVILPIENLNFLESRYLEYPLASLKLTEFRVEGFGVKNWIRNPMLVFVSFLKFQLIFFLKTRSAS